jgi:hypothetical protein
MLAASDHRSLYFPAACHTGGLLRIQPGFGGLALHFGIPQVVAGETIEKRLLIITSTALNEPRPVPNICCLLAFARR